MLHIPSLREGITVYKALDSDVRLDIIALLLENDGMNLNDIASTLNIKNSALTYHMKLLEESGIVAISGEKGGHGNQKRYAVCQEKILIDMHTRQSEKDRYKSSIKVGHYSDFEVSPTCGLANSSALLGEVDDPRYFAHDNRYSADILWFAKGYVEYAIPSFVPENQQITQISVSAELGSEAPGFNNDWPSDIVFSVNNIKCGMWTSPGDLGGTRGVLTPEWWYENWGQYGILKNFTVNEKGTFIDGDRVSDVTIHDLHLNYMSIIKFKLEVQEDAEHVGGLTIYGKGFGNTNQEIEATISFKPMDK